MGSIKVSIVAISLMILKEATCQTSPGSVLISSSSSPAAAVNASKFQKDVQMLSKLPKRKDDCNPDSTQATLSFLSLTNKELGEKSDKELQDMGLDKNSIDCSLRKTDLDKLRSFLDGEGFAGNPGSLRFVNAQDMTIKIDCGTNARWTIEGSKDDHEWNEEGISGRYLNQVSPVDSLYFRIYTCRGIESKCSHSFYVITRPQPMIDYPLQFSQGDEIEVMCSVKPCLYKECHGMKPRPSPPYFFEWVLPPVLFDDSAKSDLSCRNRDEYTADSKGPIYVKFERDPDGNPVASPKPKNDSGVEVKLSGKTKIEVAKGDVTEKQEVLVRSSVMIKSGNDDHRGVYECIVIDGNGVPSMPSEGSVEMRYTGMGTLHVRNIIWLIVPAVLIIIMIILVLVINFLCPLKMESDDGEVYTSDGFVAPEGAE